MIKEPNFKLLCKNDIFIVHFSQLYDKNQRFINIPFIFIGSDIIIFSPGLEGRHKSRYLKRALMILHVILCTSGHVKVTYISAQFDERCLVLRLHRSELTDSKCHAHWKWLINVFVVRRWSIFPAIRLILPSFMHTRLRW